MIVAIIMTIIFIAMFVVWAIKSSHEEKNFAFGVFIFFAAIAVLWFLCVALPTLFVDGLFSIFQ